MLPPSNVCALAHPAEAKSASTAPTHDNPVLPKCIARFLCQQTVTARQEADISLTGLAIEPVPSAQFASNEAANAVYHSRVFWEMDKKSRNAAPIPATLISFMTMAAGAGH